LDRKALMIDAHACLVAAEADWCRKSSRSPKAVESAERAILAADDAEMRMDPTMAPVANTRFSRVRFDASERASFQTEWRPLFRSRQMAYRDNICTLCNAGI